MMLDHCSDRLIRPETRAGLEFENMTLIFCSKPHLTLCIQNHPTYDFDNSAVAGEKLCKMPGREDQIRISSVSDPIVRNDSIKLSIREVTITLYVVR